eukprot:8544248-Pyramimonas_sp.AAC.1
MRHWAGRDGVHTSPWLLRVLPETFAMTAVRHVTRLCPRRFQSPPFSHTPITHSRQSTRSF